MLLFMSEGANDGGVDTSPPAGNYDGNRTPVDQEGATEVAGNYQCIKKVSGVAGGTSAMCSEIGPQCGGGFSSVR